MERRKTMRMLKSKKAIEVWISWVLLMGFVAVLSVMMYDFIIDFSNDVSDDIERIAVNTEECKSIAISIDSICKQTTSIPYYLNLTVTNRLNLNVDELIFRMFDSNNHFLNISALNVTTEFLSLRPQQSKKLRVNLSDSDFNTVQVIPITHNIKKDLRIVCRDKIVEKMGVLDC